MTTNTEKSPENLELGKREQRPQEQRWQGQRPQEQRQREQGREPGRKKPEGGKNKSEPNAFPVDFHTHILPGIDDGCRGMEESSEQLRDACAYGIRRIVATPHYYPQRDTVSAFLGRRDAAYDRLLAAKTRMPEVFTGAEVLLWPGIDRMQDLHKLCIGTSKTLLIEMPYTSCWDREVTDTLFRLCASYTVVLAHPERYPKESIRQLLTADPILQINAYSFFKLRSRARVQALLSSGRRILLGSDNHGREPYYRTFVKAAALLARKHTDSMDCANSLLEA